MEGKDLGVVIWRNNGGLIEMWKKKCLSRFNVGRDIKVVIKCLLKVGKYIRLEKESLRK